MTQNISGKRTIWIVTDGKAGDMGLCRAIANRMDCQVEERTVSPRAPWSWFMPDGPCDPREKPGSAGGPLDGSFPDYAIATGRRSVSYLRALKKVSPSTFTIFLKNPRTKKHGADFLWAPAHDGISGPGIFTTDLAPHPVTREALERARGNMRDDIASLPGPRLGIVLGGPSGGTRYDRDTVNSLVSRIHEAAKPAGSVLVTPSRRTPPEITDRIREAVSFLPHFVWNGDGDNPYHELLAASDALVVTADSHNMMSETLAVGVQTHIFRPHRLDRKLETCLNTILENGWALPLSGPATFRPSRPVDHTPDISEAIGSRSAAPDARRGKE